MTVQLLNKDDLFRRVVRRKPPLSKMSVAAAWIRFAKLQQITRLLEQCPLDRPECRCLAIIHSTMFGENQISAQTPHINCEHSGREVMIWVCFAGLGSGQLAVIESTMN